MKFLSDIRLLFIGTWLGAAFFFIAVAQSAFAVLPEREMAGLIVNRTLAILNYSGLAIAILMAAFSFAGQSGVNRILLWSERILLLIFAAACAIGQFVIGWWLLLLRSEMGKPIDQVAVDDPLRIQFNNLHEYSVWVLFSGMFAALIAFFVIANRKSGAAKSSGAGIYDFQKEFKI